MTISNCGSDERGKISGGKAGDQTGKEWRIRSWYSSPWNVILRHPDAKVRELIASMAEASAKNDNIGYDQYQRETFWNELKKVGYKPEKIKTKCESDCSAGVAAIVKGAGYRLGDSKMKALSQSSYTGNLRARLKAAGFVEYTASKYLNSDAYLMRGDVLLKESGHTAINLTNGKYASANTTTTTKSTGGTTVNVTLNTIKNGSTGKQVKTIQRILNGMGYSVGFAGIDGVFGSSTESAVKKFQKENRLDSDGIVGQKTWNALLK